MNKKFKIGILSVIAMSFILVSGEVFAAFKKDTPYIDPNPKSSLTNQYPFYKNISKQYNESIYALGPGGYAEGLIHWVRLISNLSISTNYYTKVFDADTGTLLANDTQLNIGDKISFKLKGFEDTDIVWNGTGRYVDTPYGRWVNNINTPPSQRCAAHDYIGTTAFSWAVIPQYSPFLVQKPQYHIEHNGTAQLNCSNNGFDCIVESSGTIDSQITINETQGRMYYQYRWFGTCYYTNIPSKIANDSMAYAWDDYGFVISWYLVLLDPSQSPTFIHTVPQQTFEFNFEVEDGDGIKLGKPIISGPTEGFVGNTYTFSMTGTHPENKQIRFAVDIENNVFKTILAYTAWMQPSNSLSQNTNNEYDLLSKINNIIQKTVLAQSDTDSVDYNQTYSNSGTKYISSISEDSDGNKSTPSDTHTIEIYPRPTVTVSASDTNITKGGQVDITWSSTNADSCESSELVTNKNTGGTSQESPENTKTYFVTCTKTINEGTSNEDSSSVTDSVEVVVSEPENQCNPLTVSKDTTRPSISSWDYCKNGITPSNINEVGNGWSYDCDYSTNCSAVCESGTSLDEYGVCRANEVDVDVDVDIDTGFKIIKRIVSSESESCTGEYSISSENDISNISCSILNNSGETVYNININPSSLSGSVDENLFPRNSYRLSCVYNDGNTIEEFNSEPQRCMLNPNFEEF